MRRLKIKDILQNGETGKTVVARGWVRTKRGSKNVNFIALNDGSTINNLQIVADVDNFDESILREINTGAALAVTGKLVESAGSGQKVELLPKKLSCSGLPIQTNIPFSPRNIHSNFCAKMLTFVFAPTHLVPFSEFAMPWLLPFTTILTKMDLSTCTPQL